MPLFTPAERQFATAVGRLTHCNPFLPERIEWERVALGDDFDSSLSYLERTYNDGTRYVLHYITAREAYNLARAAAEGATGEPQHYLDAYIGQYQANSCASSTCSSAVTNR